MSNTNQTSPTHQTIARFKTTVQKRISTKISGVTPIALRTKDEVDAFLDDIRAQLKETLCALVAEVPANRPDVREALISELRDYTQYSVLANPRFPLLFSDLNKLCEDIAVDTSAGYTYNGNIGCILRDVIKEVFPA